ncbi:MAG: carboxylating nicotinate-nucleotide diphosphorylase [Muribaculaceae bacterium]|nr:carboxylating nicotinate-nucleotide diphosphorylase [Muribaculaceae bacterium]
MKTKEELIDDLLDLAFAEDIGDGDHTTLSTIPADAKGRSKLLIKAPGVVSGIDAAIKVLHKIDPEVKVEVLIPEGSEVKPGDIVFTAEGSVRSLLMAERTLLNIMQRMSGVATMTRSYQDKLNGLHTKVLDTRKTTPGMRMLEKEAVKTGGGENHRIGLYDMILIKDNHIDFAGGIEKAVERAKDYCNKTGRDLKIEVEARSLDDVRKLSEMPAVDRIMFDNFSPEQTREAVKIVAGRKETESSGGITIQNLREYGETGVDYISVGALTHSVKGLDMSFKAF